MSNTTATAAEETGGPMESTAKDGFAVRLKSAREAANMTLSELAERAGISKTYLWQLETGHTDAENASVGIMTRLAAALTVSITSLMRCERPWAQGGGTIRDMRRPITEEWLIANGFRIESGRNDDRLPIRSLSVGCDFLEFVGGRSFLRSTDDLNIDVSPAISDRSAWHVWLAQREPYRFVPIRYMRETHEIIRLYEALTGRVWPGEL